MHRSIATVSLSGTLRQKLEAIAAAGFDGIELFEPDFIHFKGSAADLRRIAADLGLSIDLYQPLRDMEGLPDAAFARALDRAERKFDLMQELGAPLVLCCSNTLPQSIGDPELAAAQLHALAERAARRNLRVGYEALAWGRHTARFGQAWDIVRRADHPHLGLILDSFHTLSLRDDPDPIAGIPGDRIFFVQMADAPLMSLDVLQWARHHRVFPGQGDFDVIGFFEQLLRAGYTGPLSLEIFNDLFRETPNRRTAVDAMRSLLYLESEARQRLSALPVQPLRVELFNPPPAPTLQGVSFIEFAADEASAGALDGALRSLGFVRAGRHRSKAATLYRQGGIHLIVNAQPDSFARSRFAQHGTSVCALGLRCDDAIGALGRAKAMRSQPYDSPLGPHEQRVPATVAPGGNLVHFVPAALGVSGLFESDFMLESAAQDAEGPDPGLRCVDHLTLGLGQDQRDTWALFTRAVLGLDRMESLDLADPFGLVRSQGVANADRSVRLVLNVPLGQHTATARQLGVTGAGAVHHITFGCDDIFAAVAALRARGVAFVPVSYNYYDDLQARLDLPPGLPERLRAAGVLFDRSPGGDYLHAYTESLPGGVFFEIAQRTGGYDGWGAANAAARAASLAQQ
ncbi:bifunctional sugar phosphate isomerase/epimerase/4-hydroxyphenylpyruvate dioxygenase family protein [Paracidovorax cattleyae]|nr:sugar phosphate isomerase/epimerase and 4-hydroxyphenylpyruvate domain-containing protein [Paracidovorax cattleyae]AVS76231.1 sugar phosphate isomerase/epimerase and 4-hydroxyphenylpyruvate domain-containing protein [Paracidovorax cattleyae]MBF9265074.1 sugar phosphate isomerase/epimerase and 4-hydroxyphenylpyruvate domain-containing protein [Paracidovorax cattleyae]